MAHLAELEDRISKCNKILGENPNSQIFAALAEAYRKKGDIDKAFRICQSGLKIHPNYGSAHLVMAKINLDKGMNDWAEMEVMKAVECDGNSSATELLLSEIYIHKGELDKAIRILNKLNSQDANNQSVIKMLELARNISSQAERQHEAESAEEIDEEPVSEYAPVDISAAEPPADGSKKKDGSNISIIQLLENIVKVKNVEGALLINSEGLVAEQCWADEVAPDQYGAFAREIEKNIQSQIGEFGFGAYQNILIEADNLVISFRPLGNNLLLVKANGKINLGSLRLKLGGLLERFKNEY